MISNNFKKSYNYFEATADIGLEAYGNSLNEAFENAGVALFNIISDTDGILAKNEIEFELNSEDNVSLLYDFLEELLFYHETEFMLFSSFHVEIDNFHLKAKIKGETINWDKHERKCEVKAITYHKMEVIHDDYVTVRAIVDL